MRVCWLVLLVPSIAMAEEFRDGGGFRVDLEASSVLHAGKGEPSVEDVTMLNAHVSLSSGWPHLRYFVQLDLAAGATFADEGFAFDVSLLPVGFGYQFSRPEHTAFVGVAAGIGASGGPPALASAAAIPIQLEGVFRLSEGINLLSRVRGAWMISGSKRDDGSPTASFVDELGGMIALQRSREMNYLEGRYLGIAYRELQGGRFVGLVFGTGGGEEVFTGR